MNMYYIKINKSGLYPKMTKNKKNILSVKEHVFFYNIYIYILS